MKRIVATFKSGRETAFYLSDTHCNDVLLKMINASSKVQLLIFENIVINLDEVEHLSIGDIKKEQNDDTAT